MLLQNAVKFNLAEFQEVWQQSVPEGMTTRLDQLKVRLAVGIAAVTQWVFIHYWVTWNLYWHCELGATLFSKPLFPLGANDAYTPSLLWECFCHLGEVLRAGVQLILLPAPGVFHLAAFVFPPALLEPEVPYLHGCKEQWCPSDPFSALLLEWLGKCQWMRRTSCLMM